MTPQQFLSYGLKNSQPVTVTFVLPESGNQRTVRLFFRGFRPKNKQAVARSANDLMPVFSPPSSKGKMNKKYYTACDTSFENIIAIDLTPWT